MCGEEVRDIGGIYPGSVPSERAPILRPDLVPPPPPPPPGDAAEAPQPPKASPAPGPVSSLGCAEPGVEPYSPTLEEVWKAPEGGDLPQPSRLQGQPDSVPAGLRRAPGANKIEQQRQSVKLDRQQPNWWGYSCECCCRGRDIYTQYERAVRFWWFSGRTVLGLGQKPFRGFGSWRHGRRTTGKRPTFAV